MCLPKWHVQVWDSKAQDYLDNRMNNYVPHIGPPNIVGSIGNMDMATNPNQLDVQSDYRETFCHIRSAACSLLTTSTCKAGSEQSGLKPVLATHATSLDTHHAIQDLMRHGLHICSGTNFLESLMSYLPDAFQNYYLMQMLSWASDRDTTTILWMMCWVLFADQRQTSTDNCLGKFLSTTTWQLSTALSM